MERILSIYLHDAILSFENGNKEKAKILCQKIQKVSR
jgi:hypothetical protein